MKHTDTALPRTALMLCLLLFHGPSRADSAEKRKPLPGDEYYMTDIWSAENFHSGRVEMCRETLGRWLRRSACQKLVLAIAAPERERINVANR